MISVVIPVYNAEKHLDATIKSVLAQSYSNFEVIIINDGSTDNSLEVLSQYKDARIKIYSQDNFGVSYSRNKGAYLAKYDYLAFLDSDDVWNPEYLSKKLNCLQNSDFDMVFCYEQSINENYEKEEKYYFASKINFFEKLITIHPDYAVGPSNLFIRRKAFLSSVGFNQALSNTADKMLLIDLLSEFTYTTLNEVLLFYKTHDFNMHKNIKKTKIDFELFKKCLDENYFQNNKYSHLTKIFNSKYRLIMAYYSLKTYRPILFLLNIFRSFLNSPVTFINYLSLKNKLRELTFQLMFEIRIFNFLFQRNIRKNRKPIALFHRVSPQPDHIWQPLKPDAFEKIIIQFKKYYVPVSIEDFLHKKDLPKNAICVVFDDGFIDFRDFALPILKKHNIPTSLFVPTQLIEEKKQIWTYELGVLIRLTAKISFEFAYNNRKINFDLSTERGKNNCSKDLISIFRGFTATEINDAMSRIKLALGDNSALGQRLLTTEELVALKDDVSIHSHSANHYYLSKLSDEELDVTLETSLNYIKSHFNNPSNLIAYPIGDVNEKVISKVKNHFDYGFIVGDQNVEFNKLNQGDENFKIPRFNIHHNNPIEVLFKLAGFHAFFASNKKLDY